MDHTKKYKGELHEFYLNMKRWRNFRTRYKLDWIKVHFDKNSQTKVPAEKGIYIFTLELASAKLPTHGYIMYFGIAGHESDNTLRKRFGNYWSEYKNSSGRPAVLYMMKNWPGDLFFNFVAFKDPAVDLKKIESSFLGAIVPPVNKKDIDSQILSARAAAF